MKVHLSLWLLVLAIVTLRAVACAQEAAVTGFGWRSEAFGFRL
jgi:hypothetical protein